jgi:hypothetical protein
MAQSTGLDPICRSARCARRKEAFAMRNHLALSFQAASVLVCAQLRRMCNGKLAFIGEQHPLTPYLERTWG